MERAEDEYVPTESVLALDTPLPLPLCHPMIIIQARMGSTRLPGKVMIPVNGVPLLQGFLERLCILRPSIPIVLATTTSSSDNVVAALGNQVGVSVFRGSEEDVLDRYVQAVAPTSADVVIRLTGDCPLVDPAMVAAAVKLFEGLSADYLSNTIHRTFPRGFDIEVMKRAALEKAAREATLPADREHVTLYIIRHPKEFHLASFISVEDLSNWRLTIDTADDLKVVRFVLSNLQSPFSFDAVRALLHRHPQWRHLNAHVEQKKD